MATEEPSVRTVALVTGAARGIGLGIAEALCEAGLKVALGDVDGESAARSSARLRARGFEAIGVALDVARWDDWRRAVDEATGRWGGLDVLVNNAGVSP